MKYWPLYSLIFSIILASLDFKASASGKGFLIQIPIWLFYFSNLFFTVFNLTLSYNNIKEIRLYIIICLNFIIFSTIIGFYYNQHYWDIITNVVSFFIFFSATILTLYVIKTCKDLAKFINSMQFACLFFLILHFIVILLTRGRLNLLTSRYEYLSGATIAASSLFTIGAVLRFGWRECVISVLNLAIILISVTRTQVAVIAGQLTSAFLAFPTMIFRPNIARKLLLAISLVVVVLAIDLGSGLGLTDRWVTRFTQQKDLVTDPTALTRYAEIHFMYNQFTASFARTLFGNGLAAQTKLTGPSAKLAEKLVGAGSVTSVRSNGFGHNNHVSVLFVGGLFFGAPLLLINFVNGFQGFLLLRKLIKPNKFSKELVYIGTWGSLIVIGTLTFGFLAGTYSQRGDCLWYGIGVGMLYWAKEQVKQAPQQQGASVCTKTP